MIRGFFEPRHTSEHIEAWPKVTALVFLPRPNAKGLISFLIDTGADYTCLHLQDSLKIIPDFSQLTGVIPVGGVSEGVSYYATEIAALIFLDTGNKPVLETVPALRIGLPNHSSRSAPSLLGRDVLSRYQLIVDPRSNILLLL